VEVWFMTMRERQRQVQLYRGQIPSPGRPTVAWREDRVRFWAAVGRGASSEDAAREIGVPPAVGSRWFRQAGGVAPNLPPAVSGRYLSFAEREDIAIWHARKAGVREIARRLGRSPSTISRELRRNASSRTWRLDYRASTAQWHAERRARRPKVWKLAADERLREYVQDRLAGVIRAPDGSPVPGPVTRFSGRRHGPRQDRRWAACWSPEQIAPPAAGRLPMVGHPSGGEPLMMDVRQSGPGPSVMSKASVSVLPLMPRMPGGQQCAQQARTSHAALAGQLAESSDSVCGRQRGELRSGSPGGRQAAAAGLF
jgi:transposase-like protein